MEDVLKAALEGKCIVWVGGGAAAAASGGWLVAAVTPEILASRKTDNDTVNVAQIEHDGRHTPRKVDNNNVEVDQADNHEEEPPEMVPSCTQWEESDLEVALGLVPARTLPQLWANVKTPTAAIPNPVIVKAGDKPATEDSDTKKATVKVQEAAVKVDERDWTKGAQTEAPARIVSGREKGVSCPAGSASGPEDRHTRSTLGTQTVIDSDQDAVLGGVTRTTLTIQTDVESDRDAVLGGVGDGHPLMVSGETQTGDKTPPWGRRWTPGCDHREALPELGRECSSAAGEGAAEKEVCLSLLNRPSKTF